MLKVALIYLSTVSVLTLLIYGWDKLLAVGGGRRIPERTLLFTSVIGGALGGLLGMLLFRHKTRRVKFFTVNIFSLGLHIGAILLLAFAG